MSVAKGIKSIIIEKCFVNNHAVGLNESAPILDILGAKWYCISFGFLETGSCLILYLSCKPPLLTN